MTVTAAKPSDPQARMMRQHGRKDGVQQQRDGQHPACRLRKRIADEQHERRRQRRGDQRVCAAALVGQMGHDRRGQDLGQEGGGDDQPDDGGIHAAAGEPQGQERDADALQAVIQERWCESG
ncbi:hypothetical protein G6F50_016420 [Rhizopus delemar]|uniref:Uncharacterized protein n=1 Tax=Rhizopus delemar TaxID=936053 RepID=A0A9P6XU57_9FUNG|nr:hypothetical protein G6F50_016420 [Rhizopus delemar]